MKKLTAIIAAIALSAGMASAGFAGEMHGKKAKETTKQADSWKAGDPVETGAVPGRMEKSKPSLIDTHYDPFNPDLRPIDKAGSSGG